MPVFKSGVFAAVICLGLCWMVNIFIGAQSTFLTETVSQFTNKYPWVFIIACYLVGNITTSQGSTTAIVIPLGLALGISTPVLLAGWVTIGSHFLIPAASESLAAIAFDTAGTDQNRQIRIQHQLSVTLSGYGRRGCRSSVPVGKCNPVILCRVGIWAVGCPCADPPPNPYAVILGRKYP